MEIPIDRSCQVLRLEVPVARGSSEKEVELVPDLSQLAESGRMVSAAVLAAKAKAFDDGLMAAVELVADRGAGRLKGKNELLAGWLERSMARPEAASSLWVGLRLRGLQPFVPPEVEQIGLPAMTEFLGARERSHPLAFYCWSPELVGIFRRDRFLQAPLDPIRAQALLDSLGPDREVYEAHLRLAARLTNPLVEEPAALGRPGSSWAVFPPSRAVETDLARQLLGQEMIPEGFNLIDELMQRVEQGQLSLLPGPEDGWYAHQQWCLEPLLRPDQALESPRVERGRGYQACLRELCRAVLAMTRETHVKQLELPILGCAARREKPRVHPSLSLEPLVTYYQRRAESYAFARQALEEAFGRQALSALVARQTRQGPAGLPLGQELEFMEALFRGCASQSAFEVGLPWPVVDRRVAAGWLKNLGADPDVGQDVRCLVPLFFDQQRRCLKVLAVLGYAHRPLDISYVCPPAVPAGVEVEFARDSEPLYYPVAIEVHCRRLLDRDEFRSLCDRHPPTISALRAALESL
ncbi:hypothetical protein DYH09_19965 [bacterium CPR1]|nr:hypothetical protein [bacterium CPR1]